MYEISPRHAAGIRKNYFDAQLMTSPKTLAQVKALMSYSGFRFKSFRDFFAYYKNISIKLDKVALYSVVIDPSKEDPQFYTLACIATPLSKTVINSANGQSYVEDYLKLQLIELTSDPTKGYLYKALLYPQHCEITSHTIERIIQRLKTTQIDNITFEIKSSVSFMTNMFNALAHYPIDRWPKRMVIPSRSGAFLVEIDAKTQTILYRTFVKDEMFDFQEQSVTATREWIRKAAQTNAMTSKLASELLTHKANKWWFDPNKDQKFTSSISESVS